MSRLSRSKHLLFYVGVLGIVLVLFQAVTTYGEANLKAPPNLNGRYRSTSTPPGCAEGDRLMLTLQQSGIYVNGFVTLESANDSQTQSADATSEEKPSLTGLWKPEQLSLSGEANALIACTAGRSSRGTSLAIALQGQVTATTFTGQLSYESQPGNVQPGNVQPGNAEPWQFTAERQAPAKAKSGH